MAVAVQDTVGLITSLEWAMKSRYVTPDINQHSRPPKNVSPDPIILPEKT